MQKGDSWIIVIIAFVIMVIFLTIYECEKPKPPAWHSEITSDNPGHSDW